MATAPYQLWIDIAPISTAIRVASTVTVTTASSHSLTTGAYIQMAGATGTAGTSLNGVYQATVTSGTTFTYTAAGTAGTAFKAIGAAAIAAGAANTKATMAAAMILLIRIDLIPPANGPELCCC